MDAVSVTFPTGFSAAGVAAGIKPSGLDLSLVVSDRPCVAAGMFTRNRAAAAPVEVSREHLERSSLKRAVVINSGCANAATGVGGLSDARATAGAVAARLGIDTTEVLVCSTGTIGPRLPMDRLVAGADVAIGKLDHGAAAGEDAATAILTTDSVSKTVSASFEGWSIGGMAKGAGMVRPDMATMLAVLTSDAAVTADELDAALRIAVDGSFHSLNIDGCESTNDSVLVLANGASGVRPDVGAFADALEGACRTLALAMARDAEGASRVVLIDVDGAATDEAARRAGRQIADSVLVRSSFYGGDVNWGRVIGALGSAPISIDPGDVEIRYEGVVVFSEGIGADYDETALLAECESGDLHLSVRMGRGDGSASVVTTDLTPEYVVFNGERS